MVSVIPFPALAPRAAARDRDRLHRVFDDQLRPLSSSTHASKLTFRGDAQHMLTCIQAYHSALNEEPDIRQVGNLGIYPIKTRVRGPAPVAGIFFVSSPLSLTYLLSQRVTSRATSSMKPWTSSAPTRSSETLRSKDPVIAF